MKEFKRGQEVYFTKLNNKSPIEQEVGHVRDDGKIRFVWSTDYVDPKFVHHSVEDALGFLLQLKIDKIKWHKEKIKKLYDDCGKLTY